MVHEAIEKPKESDIVTLFQEDETTKKRFILFLFSFYLLMTVTSLVIGNYQTSIWDVIEVFKFRLFGIGDPSFSLDTIVWNVRLPRILGAGLVGAALAVAGCAFQGVFRNPLVEPYILGVSSGAAFGAALSIVLGFNLFTFQFNAFFFALIATFLTYSIATVDGRTRMVTLLLSGIIIGSLFNALLSFLKIISLPGQLQEITFWLMGGFYTLNWTKLESLAFFIPLSIILILFLTKSMNLLSLGDETASTMGVNVGFVKVALIVLGTLITAISVSFVGIIAWVGLLVPHLCRMVIGPDNRYLVPGSAFLGAGFLVLCDTLARSLVTWEIPITILTSIIGAPVLIYIIRKYRTYHFG